MMCSPGIQGFLKYLYMPLNGILFDVACNNTSVSEIAFEQLHSLYSNGAGSFDLGVFVNYRSWIFIAVDKDPRVEKSCTI